MLTGVKLNPSGTMVRLALVGERSLTLSGDRSGVFKPEYLSTADLPLVTSQSVILILLTTSTHLTLLILLLTLMRVGWRIPSVYC